MVLIRSRSDELLLFAPSGLHPVRLADRRLAAELARGVLGYLVAAHIDGAG
jgi:hypothetical protein